MPKAATMPEIMTLGQVADRFGVKDWQLRYLFKTKKLPPAKRFGKYRVFVEADLPAIEVALREAGFMK